jgi:hypothetical protein
MDIYVALKNVPRKGPLNCRSLGSLGMTKGTATLP